jgi:hypothetical protein
MQEREKILSGEEKKRALAARTVYVSLDRADAIIEGAPHTALACGGFELSRGAAFVTTRSGHLSENGNVEPRTIGLHQAGRLPEVLHRKCALPHPILSVQFDTHDA